LAAPLPATKGFPTAIRPRMSTEPFKTAPAAVLAAGISISLFASRAISFGAKPR